MRFVFQSNCVSTKTDISIVINKHILSKIKKLKYIIDYIPNNTAIKKISKIPIF